MKVVQCWDDGVVTDIRLIEILKKYNAKATFNLNPGYFPAVTTRSRWQKPLEVDWSCKGFLAGKIGFDKFKKVYSGFKVASHCWSHETVGFVPDEEFLLAAVKARKFLEDMFEIDCPGFAWPCGVFSTKTENLLKEAGFKYARTTLNASDITKCENAMQMPTNCHFQDSRFWERYENAKSTGVFYFWGHSYETLNYPPLWKQFEDKIRYISEDPDAEWADVIDIVPKTNKK